ncbi:MAG: AmmeMemoRadiSam system radical SAM enzyme [Deltaproteobacteria bacterium]|nr:AmmeMemoRadiSam system radical SAM enzyme [Deltaproteobacteria bacterium]
MNQALTFSHKLSLAVSLLTCAICVGLMFIAGTPQVAELFDINDTYVREARFWERRDLGVQCTLCPHDCYLTEGARGKCRVRVNRGATLYTLVYNQAVSANIDPIEKKPVFHMLPASSILSISTVGCPLTCSFCQNWSLSQIYPEEVQTDTVLTPEAVVAAALRAKTPSIAYTYGEPVIFYEYMYDIARLAKENGLKNVMVTSGYFNPEPLREIAPLFDVVKVDLKGISPEFYREEVGGYLEAVLESLKVLKASGTMVEVVNLVVPRRNDSQEDISKLSRWVLENLGPDTPLFFSRFHPAYRLTNLPATPLQTLERARDDAMQIGLNFVYIGNVPGHPAEDTYCPDCGRVLIDRQGYWVKINVLHAGRCPDCDRVIPGVW